MNANIPPAKNQHALPDSTPFIVGDSTNSNGTPNEKSGRFDDAGDSPESRLDAEVLASLGIDQLRELATRMGVPDVGAITETDELIDEIEARLG